MDACKSDAASVQEVSVMRAKLTAMPMVELLHRYNDARDLAHSLMHLIALQRQCTIAEVYDLPGISAETE